LSNPPAAGQPAGQTVVAIVHCQHRAVVAKAAGRRQRHLAGHRLAGGDAHQTRQAVQALAATVVAARATTTSDGCNDAGDQRGLHDRSRTHEL